MDKVGEAAVGVALELLLISVAVHATPKLACFSSDLNRLKSIVDLIEPANIAGENEVFDRARKMVDRCSVLRWWNFFTRLYYSLKISQLEAELSSFLQLNALQKIERVLEENVNVVSQLEQKVSDLEANVSELCAFAAM
ncbi:Unknown protein [Striga hermonthica]|uniref:RPW8 domain-containing protein n=1 Tax=Striga hermonthica TaxID=68872 RepID=A0A9N7N8T8_STRHE|nr:Unknown protein [Striga hermonthica]